MGGLDALLSTVQMPPGFPVGTVAMDKAGARNAAWMAAQILALQDPALADRIRAARAKCRPTWKRPPPKSKPLIRNDALFRGEGNPFR